ncbi:uncharacterized protein LOC108103531 isoform X2 [Drosophila eugracilis]|uniref:uncharacterized protein LOC108103531 isoform X2 n=1 Tax=Drosophila eugracilis TaxID=29029 RepID=UPI0007E6D571|nr:uncharacterized protein LOC108103531 isoform X2 [Drosophila eugracilis]
MSLSKQSIDLKPQASPLAYGKLKDLDEMDPINLDVPNRQMGFSSSIVDHQVDESIGELQRIFESLAPSPSPVRELPNNSLRNINKSDPVFYGWDEAPAGRISRGQIKRTHTRNPILNPEETELEIEEKPQQALLAIENQTLDLPEDEMNAKTRLLVIKFFNLMHAKLWRRRRSEVGDLHTLVRKYQAHAARTQTELLTRNQMICLEQRRGEQLSHQLMRAMSRIRMTMESCAELDNELQQLKMREAFLNSELASKSQECSNFAEMLEICRSEMFRELENYRENAAELAKQQKRAFDLEHENAQLEDQLLTIKDQFALQNDQMSVALAEKQEQLNTAYETLKRCEQELAKLELKYKEALRQNEIDEDLQKEISNLKKSMGFARYMIFYLTEREWGYCQGAFQGYVYHMVAETLDCLAPAFATPPMADNLLRIAIAAVFLLIAMY